MDTINRPCPSSPGTHLRLERSTHSVSMMGRHSKKYLEVRPCASVTPVAKSEAIGGVHRQGQRQGVQEYVPGISSWRLEKVCLLGKHQSCPGCSPVQFSEYLAIHLQLRGPFHCRPGPPGYAWLAPYGKARKELHMPPVKNSNAKHGCFSNSGLIGCFSFFLPYVFQLPVLDQSIVFFLGVGWGCCLSLS